MDPILKINDVENSVLSSLNVLSLQSENFLITLWIIFQKSINYFKYLAIFWSCFVNVFVLKHLTYTWQFIVKLKITIRTKITFRSLTLHMPPSPSKHLFPVKRGSSYGCSPYGHLPTGKSPGIPPRQPGPDYVVTSYTTHTARGHKPL